MTYSPHKLQVATRSVDSTWPSFAEDVQQTRVDFPLLGMGTIQNQRSPFHTLTAPTKKGRKSGALNQR